MTTPRRKPKPKPKPRPMPDEFRGLMERFNQLGCLLPDENTLDLDDAAAVAEARLMLGEMDQTLIAIKAFLKAP